MAIGQGDVLVTPLQLAVGYAAIGNGGTRYVPHVVKEVRDGVSGEVVSAIEPQASGTVEMDPAWRQAIIEGLIGVTTRQGGTARSAFAGFPPATYPEAAKTGPAQANDDAPTPVVGAFRPPHPPTSPHP